MPGLEKRQGEVDSVLKRARADQEGTSVMWESASNIFSAVLQNIRNGFLGEGLIHTLSLVPMELSHVKQPTEALLPPPRIAAVGQRQRRVYHDTPDVPVVHQRVTAL